MYNKQNDREEEADMPESEDNEETDGDQRSKLRTKFGMIMMKWSR